METTTIGLGIDTKLGLDVKDDYKDKSGLYIPLENYDAKSRNKDKIFA